MVGFVLLPLGRVARDGNLAGWPDHVLSALVVLIAFENRRTRLAWPSVKNIAALAGLRTERVTDAIRKLEKNGWLQVQRAKGNRYFMRYQGYHDPGLESGDWIRIDTAVVKRGVWAAMSPSARKLYLVLRSLATIGARAEESWIHDENEFFDAVRDCDFAFLPETKADPAELRRLAGLPDRTYRRANIWLFDNGLIQVSDLDGDSGYILPFDPKRWSPEVVKAVEAEKEEPLNPSRGASRAMAWARKRGRQGAAE